MKTNETVVKEIQPNVKPYEPIYTIKEAADLLKTSTQHVYDLINDGVLPCLISGTKKIRGTDLERFINNLQPGEIM